MMKKTIIAAGIIVILGISYTAASWYTGQVIEDKFDDTLANITHQVNQYDHISGINLPDIDIQYHDYNKGLFSTSVYLTVNTQDSNDKKVLFDDKITIYHGPLPWSEIKTGHFLPKMAAFVYQTTKEYNEKLWAAAGNTPFISAKILIDYSENIDLFASNTPLNYSDDQEKVQIKTTENHLSISTDKRFNHVSVNSQIDQYAYNNQSTGFNILIKKANLVAKLVSPDQSNRQLNQELSVEQLAFNPASKDASNAIAINQLSITSDLAQQDAANLTGKLSTSIGEITYGQQQLGKLNMLMGYSATSEDDPNKPKKSVSISLDKLLWQTDQGNLDANFILDIAGNSLKLDELNEDNVNFAKANINLPFNTLAYLNAQISHPEEKSLNQDDIKNSMQFIALFSNLFLAKSPIVAVNNDPNDKNNSGLSVDLYYSKAEKRAKLKGKEYSLGQFWHAVYDNKLPSFN